MENIFQEFIYKTDQRNYPAHAHPGYQMIYLQRGSLSLRISDEPFTANAPCFIFFNNMEPHTITADGANERYILNLSSKSAKSIVRNNMFLSVFSTGKASLRIISALHRRNCFENLLSILYENYTLQPEFFADAAAHALNLIFFELYRMHPAAFVRADSKIQIAVMKIKELLETDPQAAPGLKELAAEYHFSEFYLLHCFKNITGYSIKQFQMACRLALACEMLTDGAKSVTDICFETGFGDVSNFIRYFKHKTGYPPTEYRRIFKD